MSSKHGGLVCHQCKLHNGAGPTGTAEKFSFFLN